jgi:tetratricopeptide (TPR) repeat protein
MGQQATGDRERRWGWEVSSTAREGIRTGMAPNGGEAASLVESAMLLRWRAPELALLLADRAVTAGQDDKLAVLQADHLAVFALNRLGRHGEAAHRLFPAIRDAETPPGLRHELHVELAHCAVALGESATALGAVRAVLAAGDDVAPVLRAGALVAVAEASAALGRDDLATSALDEADELYREDPSLDHDTALLLRAAVRAVDAARHRRREAGAMAEAKAREGRDLLAGLADPEHDSGEVSARLMLEIALALLDRGAGDAAMQEVRSLLRRPVRAAAAAAVGRLRLALATRVHLAEGRHEPALTLLADAVEGAQRYGVDVVLGECLEGLSHVHEARGEFADALHCVRAARAAEGRHRRDVEAARGTLLDNCGSVRREEARLVAQVAALLGDAGTGCAAGSEADTSPLSVEAGVGSAAQQTDPETLEAEIAEADSAEAEGDEAEVLEAEIAQAEVIEAGLGEAEASEQVAEERVAEERVAEERVAEERVAEAEPLGQIAESQIAQSAPATPVVGSRVPPSVAEGPIPVSPETAVGESSSEVDSWPAGARHRRGAGALVSVSDLLPASALLAGRSGRRRAEDRAAETPTVQMSQIGDTDPEPSGVGDRGAADRSDEPPVPLVIYPSPHQPPSESSAPLERAATDDDPSGEPEISSQTLRELPVSGPPPAPTPRALDWQPADEDEAGDEAQMGLGDLLAEALAAYQESRDIHAGARSAGMRSDDGSTTADVELDVSRYPGLRMGRTAGLALAPQPINANSGGPDSVDADAGDPAAEVTNPLLRLPNLTAEPRWGSA